MQFKYTRHNLDGKCSGWGTFESFYGIHDDEQVDDLVRHLDDVNIAPPTAQVFVIHDLNDPDGSEMNTRVVVLAPPQKATQIKKLRVD